MRLLVEPALERASLRHLIGCMFLLRPLSYVAHAPSWLQYKVGRLGGGSRRLRVIDRSAARAIALASIECRRRLHAQYFFDSGLTK
jgi:hypothetical protein